MVSSLPKLQPDYTARTIRWLLENYSFLAAGKMPAAEGSGYTEYGTRIGRSPSGKAIFERPLQMKADIDRALQSLAMKEKFVILGMYLSPLGLNQTAFLLGSPVNQVAKIEARAVRSMQRFLR